MDTITTTPSASLQSGTVASESSLSAVSWAAVMGGALVAAALSLVLLALGAGLGLSSVSPWSNAGATAATIGTATIVWLIFMQIAASSMGGYLAGRLRTKWTSVHNDEVFFRDTAHGFLVWAVGLVIAASFLASAATSLLGGAAKAGATAISAAAVATAGAAADGANQAGARDQATAYFSDTLVRSDRPEGVDAGSRAEVGRIFAQSMQRDGLSTADKTYLVQLISAKAGITPVDAEKRINEVMAHAKNAEMEVKQAADTARSAAARLSLWMFLALLIGAFCASYAATIGGRQRDQLMV